MKDFLIILIITVILLLLAIIVGFGIGYLQSKYPIHAHTQPSDSLPTAQTTPERLITLDDLLNAIEQVESGGDANAVGDGGAAVGSFQIHKIYVDDVNRIQLAKHEERHMGYLPYKYHWRKDRNISRDMVSIYLRYYATMRRIDRKPTAEDMARIHNGGPNGWKKDSTKEYWGKVKIYLAVNR